MSTKYSVNVVGELSGVFEAAIKAAFPALETHPVAITPSTKAGDYQCNSAMTIAGVSADHR